MCGRFYISKDTLQTMNRSAPHLFDGLEAEVIERLASGDVRPTNQILTVTSGPKMQFARWGFARDFKSAIINATVEKLTGRFWGKSFRERRCVVFATGFYEWVEVPDMPKKQPKAIQVMDGVPMVMAGVWELNAEHGPCVSIVTTAQAVALFGVHDRCPAMFNREEMEAWLDPDTKPEAALALCKPYSRDLVIWSCASPTKGEIPRPARPTDGKPEARSMF